MGRRQDKTIATLRAKARSLGATVESDSDDRWKVYQVVAPVGKRWVEGGVHTLRVEWDSGQGAVGAEMRAESIADAIDRMSQGLEDCANDCECRDDEVP